MQALNELVESIDLRFLFIVIGTALVLMLVYVAVLAKQKCLDSTDPTWMKNARFFFHIASALSVLWMLNYAYETGWQPWPPAFALICAMTGMIVMRAIALTSRTQAEILHRMSAMLGGKVVPGTNVVIPREWPVSSVVAVSPGAEPHPQEPAVVARQRTAAGVG